MGDSLATDVKGAKAAGLYAVLLAGGSWQSKPAAPNRRPLPTLAANAAFLPMPFCKALLGRPIRRRRNTPTEFGEILKRWPLSSYDLNPAITSREEESAACPNR